MQTKFYKTKVDRFACKAGTIVRMAAVYDYGCARDDTVETGIEHVSVTTVRDGGYPFFTIAKSDLIEIHEEGETA